MTTRPLITRLPGLDRQPLSFEINGNACTGFVGDTVLTAVLACGDHVRHAEASGLPRAGFCGMGACQDCWMDTADGPRLRACTTPLVAGMKLLTRPQP